MLIGGLGRDSFYGRSGDDILIGGTTDHDANEEALLAILAEWEQQTPIDDRIANLTNGGGANGLYLLPGFVDTHLHFSSGGRRASRRTR